MKKKTIKIILIILAVIVGLIVFEFIDFTVKNSNKTPRTAPMEKINR